MHTVPPAMENSPEAVTLAGGIRTNAGAFPLTRMVLARLALAALAAGGATFLFGRGVAELVSAPRYQRTFPIPADVSQALRHARLLWLARRVPLAGALLDETLAASSRAVPEPTAATDVAETTDRGNWIRVPALSLAFPLAVAPSMDDADILRTLQVGVVRYPNGVEPGRPGIVVVAGHSTGEPWKGRYRFAFLHAKRLRAGDAILVDHNGIRYTYRVTGQRLVNPRTTPFVETAAETPHLAILSCWPLWTTNQRLLVDAELASTARLVHRAPPPPQG